MADEPAAPTAASEHDLQDALRFVYSLGMQTRVDLSEMSTRLMAVIELLVGSGHLDLRRFEERRQMLQEREAPRERTRAHVQVSEVGDKYALTELPRVPCNELLPLCKARCCRLTFALSFQDVDERVVQWDYLVPYQVRRRPDGYCAHNHADGRGCQVYEHRPAICRTYDCRNDKRVWLDYEKREPAPDDAIAPPLVSIRPRPT